MSKFKVGDKVRVINFKENPPHWNKSGEMDKWKGKIVTLDEITRTNVTSDMEFSIVGDSGFYGQKWVWKSSDFEPINSREFIVLRRDGAKTIAELRHDREVIKSAVATCSEKDTFDFNTGAKLAFDRLMGREADEAIQRCKMPDAAPQPAHRFKVGDRVLHKEYGLGTILKIFDNDQDVPYNVKPDDAMCYVTCWAESRVSPAPAPEPPKFYTGKVFAEKSDDSLFTSRDGRIFEFVDGECVNSIPKDLMDCNREFKTIDEIRKQYSSTIWHEVKSDV